MDNIEKLDAKLKWLNKISFRGPLGLFIVVAGFIFMYFLLFVKVPKENEAILTVAMGFILAIIKDVASWYFGSSKGKEDADRAEQVKTMLDAPATPKPTK